MLRITPASPANGIRWIKVEGRLAGNFVAEFARVAATADGERLIVDLADVTFVDPGGAELLRSLRVSGVELRGCSPFVLSLLNGESR